MTQVNSLTSSPAAVPPKEKAPPKKKPKPKPELPKGAKQFQGQVKVMEGFLKLFHKIPLVQSISTFLWRKTLNLHLSFTPKPSLFLTSQVEIPSYYSAKGKNRCAVLLKRKFLSQFDAFIKSTIPHEKKMILLSYLRIPEGLPKNFKLSIKNHMKDQIEAYFKLHPEKPLLIGEFPLTNLSKPARGIHDELSPTYLEIITELYKENKISLSTLEISGLFEEEEEFKKLFSAISIHDKAENLTLNLSQKDCLKALKHIHHAFSPDFKRITLFNRGQISLPASILDQIKEARQDHPNVTFETYRLPFFP